MVHELAFADCPKSYVFRGSKDYQSKQIADMLGLNPSSRLMQPLRPGQPMPAPAASKFLMPVQACEFQLTKILEGLQRDPWPVETDKRPFRCTGVALGVAVSLLEVRSIELEQISCADIISPPFLVPEGGSCSSPAVLLRMVREWWSARSFGSRSGRTMTSTGTRSSTSSGPPR